MKENHDRKKQIICSNVHYFYYDTAFFFEKMKKAGWKRIELYLGTPHIFIDGNIIDDFAEIPRLAAQHGLEIVSVHPETISFRYHLCSLDEQWNQKSLQTYKNCIEYASFIHANSVNTNISGAFRDLENSRIFERVAENLKLLAHYGEEKGIHLTLETESVQEEGFITSLNQMRNLDECIGNDNLHFGLNMRALRAEGEAAAEWENCFPGRIEYLRFSSAEDFQKAKKDIASMKKKDYDAIFFFNDDCYLDEPFQADYDLRKMIEQWD